MRNIGENLVALGHHVTVATSSLRERTSLNHKGVNIKEFRVSGNLVNGMHGEVERYRSFVLNGDFDVLMIKAAQQWTFDALWPVLSRIQFGKVFIPCGFSALYDPRYASYYEQMPLILGSFASLIFYSEDYRDISFARDSGLSEKIVVIPNGASHREFSAQLDASFRARHNIPEDAFVLLTVGSRTGTKGHLEVCHAFDLACFPAPAVLILNGNIPSSARRTNLLRYLRITPRAFAVKVLRRLSQVFIRGSCRPKRIEGLDSVVCSINKKEGTGKRIILTDFSRNELVQAYLNSDLFVFASNIEYSPLVLFEAAAAGLPFLSVPVGNAVEIARWTSCGIICPAFVDRLGNTKVDPAVFASKLTCLANEPVTLAQLGAAGRRSWEEFFTWEAIALKYEEVLVSSARSDHMLELKDAPPSLH